MRKFEDWDWRKSLLVNQKAVITFYKNKPAKMSVMIQLHATEFEAFDNACTKLGKSRSAYGRELIKACLKIK